MEHCNRVSRNKAHLAYLQGKTIRVLPCKVNDMIATNPDKLSNPFMQAFEFSLSTIRTTCRAFDKIMNEYEYYNCNKELGYHAKFFVVEQEVENEVEESY